MSLIIINGHLPSLNDHIAAERSDKFVGAKLKKEATSICAWNAKTQCKEKFDLVYLDFHWIEKDRRRDKDNICFAKKYILDGLVNAGIIPGDGWKNVETFADRFSVDKDNPRIEISIVEMS